MSPDDRADAVAAEPPGPPGSMTRLRGVLLALPVVFLAVGLVAERTGWLSDLQILIQRRPSQFPSSQLIPEAALAAGHSILSVYVDAADLHDPERGLLAHPMQIGRDWERPATVSFADDGRLLMATGAGIRVHGGKSRTGSPVQSFRLYFRREYGSTWVPSSLFFEGPTNRLNRLVVHNDLRADREGRWWHLVNPLAFDIAKEVGALVPETRPVQFYLNGEPLGTYVLIEHVRSPYLVAHFGHDHFALADLQEKARLMVQVNRMPMVTMADVTPWLDLDNLTRWFVSIVFCATTDPFQAVMFRDETDPDGPWFWVNWDMDHSFMDLYQRAPQPWEHDTFNTTLNKAALESAVVTALIRDDPAYRERLARLVFDTLNHRLTPSFLAERYRFYQEVAESYGVRDRAYLNILAQFLVRRPAVVRELTAHYLQLGAVYQFRVDGPEGVDFLVNGHRERSGFSGWYAAGLDVTVAPAEPQPDFSHWSVNGRVVSEPMLRERLTADTVMTAEFDGS